ncbi:transcriptional regulator [Streptomyces sp. NPDC093589]|uniref:helix-turn-helix transcriptional regulator n=1 Tax=Streptomyces sp. NPDC093589 TaxID=3366043 RepID=UPI0037FB0ED4
MVGGRDGAAGAEAGVGPDAGPLLEQVRRIAEGLGRTFAPFCEVVVHDLRDPDHAIVAIENGLSGRAVGDPATELGLARLADDSYPQVIANYPNQLADGRRVKSTSVGIKDADGRYVAALCLNVDVSVFQGLANVLEQFARVDDAETPAESLEPAHAASIRARIDAFAAARATSLRALTTGERRALVRELKASGFMDLRRSAEVIAQHLGVSRATVYNDARDTPPSPAPSERRSSR